MVKIKTCSHYWTLYGVMPVAIRGDRQDVYKTRCLKCGDKQRRTFRGIDRLQRLGLIQTGRGEGIA